MTKEGPTEQNHIEQEVPNIDLNKSVDDQSLNKDIKNEQDNLIKDIEKRQQSKSIDDHFSAIETLPNIINPIIRNRFEIKAYDIVYRILKYSDLKSDSSIRTVLDAIKHINFLSGTYRNKALLQASKTYEILKLEYGESKSNLLEEIENTISDLGVDDKKPLANKNYEIYSHVSNQEKIEWILFLLRSKNWTDIADGVKNFSQLREKIFDKSPDILIESIEEKIRDVIIYGLNCKDFTSFETVKNDPKIVKAKTKLMISPLQENAVYANSMAVELIQYAPERFRKELVEIAKKNTNINNSVLESLDKNVL
jgi:hypothetical protein